MAARRPRWQKFVRVGAYLFVAVIFLPVFAIFLMQTFKLIPRHQSFHTSLMMEGRPAMMDSMGIQGGMGVTREMDYANKMGSSDSSFGMATAPMMTFPAMPMTVPTDASSRKLVRSASLDLRAQSLDKASTEIRDIVTRVGGYIESANASQPQVGMKTAWMSLRVPADRLDQTVVDVKAVASAVMNENLNVGDVTEQDINLTARLNAKRAEEAALVSLLDQATKVSDVIEVTSRLSMVRSEIEQMEAQQRMLVGQVAMASLSLSITEDPRVVANTNEIRGGNVFKRSLSELADFGIALASAFVALAITGVPVLLVYGLMIWGLYRLGRWMIGRMFPKKK